MNFKANLFNGRPVLIKGLGLIYQLNVDMLLTTGIEIDNLLMPFCVSTEVLELTAEQKADFKNFDLLFLQHFQKEPNEQKSLLEMLESNLKILMKTNHVHINFDEMCININESGRLDRNNFDDLVEVVFEIFHSRKPKPDKKKKLSDKQQKIMDKLNKHRQRKAKQNEIKIEDMLNVIIHGGTSFIRYKDAVEFTYWQLVNTYISITTIDGYKEYLAYKSSGQFEIKDTVDHWIKQLKLKTEI